MFLTKKMIHMAMSLRSNKDITRDDLAATKAML